MLGMHTSLVSVSVLLMLVIAPFGAGRLLTNHACDEFDTDLGDHLGLRFSEHLEACTTIGTDVASTLRADNLAGFNLAVFKYGESYETPKIEQVSRHALLITLMIDERDSVEKLNTHINGVSVEVKITHPDFSQATAQNHSD